MIVSKLKKKSLQILGEYFSVLAIKMAKMN